METKNNETEREKEKAEMKNRKREKIEREKNNSISCLIYVFLNGIFLIPTICTQLK